MMREEKYKHFVVALVAIFCGISTFALMTNFDLVEASQSGGREHSIKANDHIDDFKSVDPSKLVGTTTPQAGYATTTQYVLMAFDGSKSIQSWESILNFADEMKEAGTPVHFSFYINAVYFLSYQNKNAYVSPDGKVAGSAIGFSDSSQEIADRIVEINRAIRDGHEIGSHTSGHNDGSKWTVEQWNQEFESFNNILSNTLTLNPGISLKEWPMLKTDQIVGFRAPNLGVNGNLYQELYAKKFLYDCSQVSKPLTWPFKDGAGLWHIPLSTAENKFGGTVLAMDYNWWYYQTGAKNILRKGTPEWEAAKAEVVKAYKDAFDVRYNSNRSPLSIGHHFSMWNDGLYWEAMKDFARYACGQKDVRCVSHKEFVDAMEGR